MKKNYFLLIFSLAFSLFTNALTPNTEDFNNLKSTNSSIGRTISRAQSSPTTRGTNALQLASAIAVPTTEIAYQAGFSISASVKNTASTNFTGKLGLALYDAGLELLTIINPQDTSIVAGGTINCTFTSEGCSELVAGVYYASIYSKTLTSEWDSIDNGNFQNKEQFRIGIVDDCVDKIVYSCDFESELLNWTFAQADGINTGFVVDTAMKYQGKKSLYISPDGGKSTGYTQDGDSGYVSVAYKKIYLESGSYYLYHYIYRQLSFSYLDIFSDNDYYNISIIPAENKIEPLSHYKYSPSFFNNSRESQYYSSNYSYWNNYSYDFSINKSGYYYLVHTFLATDTITNNVGVAIDNIRIEKRKRSSSSISISKTETKEGVVFNINGNYPEYRVYWYTDCDRTTKIDTITNNTYTIPFSKLRDIRYGGGDLYFYVCATDECGNSNCSNYYNSYSVYTSEFPTDTCPAVPKNLKVTITDSTAIFTWQGNSSIYDIKYGKESDGCTFIDTINSLTDTTYTLHLDSTFYTQYVSNSGSTFYFFTRSICENDTSIWRYTSCTIQWPNASCWETPTNLYAQNTPEGIKLTWKGNAPKYEIECRSEDEYYRRGNKYSYNDSNYVRFIATDSMYVIPYGVLPDTLYHFRVRAVCARTGSWSEYISAYNINFGEYCIPFYDLCGPNTLCTYGSYNNPYSNKKTLDYRQKDWRDSYYTGSSYYIERGYRHGVYGWWGYNDTYYRSRHTICFEGEVDPRCDSLLTTVPPGEKYSMRLGNWYNGEGESVTYTHKIDSGHKLVLILKYAVVLQDPSHESRENPHFTLEILDENDQLLDSECLFADFAADKNATGWNVAVNAHEPTKEEFRNVVWKDWTTIGVNLSELSKYGDRVIKIRLTTKDCTRGMHYGYAYFTLQCTTANMFGIKCGERPIYFEVAEGFKYRWYLMDDTTKTSVWDQRRFEVAAPDTNSYYVDMISLENENCFYTLKAYTLPRLPQSKIEYKHTPHDCLNEVSFFNKSDVIKIMLDGSFVLDYREIIEATIWDFGEYGTSLEENPKLIVPNEGDTFTIKLKTLSNDCENIAEFLIEVPAIQDTMISVNQFMCENGTLEFLGKEYYKAGVYYDTLKRTTGCDSIIEINIDYIKLIDEYFYDTITVNQLPYVFYEQEYTSSGEYTHIVSSLGGCDSVTYHLDLQVYDELEIDLIELSEICGDDILFDIPYTINKGSFSKSSLNFNSFAKGEGFLDTVQWRNKEDDVINVSIPDSVRPDTYSMTVTFHGYGGDSITIPLDFSILYPSSIIGQRWNDFLSVKNANYNGGYTFTDYQWYLNGSPIEGYKSTQIYEYGKELDFNGEYRVLLTREDDGKSIMSCAFTPIKYNEDEYTELSTLVYTNQVVIANASHAANVKMFNIAGVCVQAYTFDAGYNSVQMPSNPGIYTMQLVYDTDKVQIIKIVVRQ